MVMSTADDSRLCNRAVELLTQAEAGLAGEGGSLAGVSLLKNLTLTHCRTQQQQQKQQQQVFRMSWGRATSGALCVCAIRTNATGNRPHSICGGQLF